MRSARTIVCWIAIASLAAVPVAVTGCADQSTQTPPRPLAPAKDTKPKAAGQESGSTIGGGVAAPVKK